MSPSSFAIIFAQASSTASTAAATPDTTQQGPPAWTNMIFFSLILLIVYFLMIRPQVQAKKKTEDTIKSAKTGDKVVTSSGIHGLITNVKDSTVIVKVADNVKLEIEKSHIEKITRPDSDAEKPVAAKAA